MIEIPSTLVKPEEATSLIYQSLQRFWAMSYMMAWDLSSHAIIRALSSSLCWSIEAKSLTVIFV